MQLRGRYSRHRRRELFDTSRSCLVAARKRACLAQLEVAAAAPRKADAKLAVVDEGSEHLGKLIERPPLARLAAVGPKAGDKPGGRLLVACIPHRHRTSRSHLGHRYILTSACPAPSFPLVPPLLALGLYKPPPAKTPRTWDGRDAVVEGEGALFISLGLISVTSPGLVRSWWVPEGPGGDELDGGAR